ncbi:hypothetical protein [Methylocystis iwaonis]|uniref:hypothetical protein n=1 Tax=Methylocystis iwaonis TaxID=2885079 RepID=UPI002E7C1B94|nr:hypothetical protein [Methylocystis iwaonis]
MQELSQEWFELKDHRRRLFSRAVWIPVYGTIFPAKRGEYPEIGHVQETLAVGSAVIFEGKRAKAEELDWHCWSLNNTTPYLNDDGRYCEASTFYEEPGGSLGFRLVLSQYHNSLHPRQVIIHQDFLLAYGLIQEGNVWVRPSEGYEQVVRRTEDENGEIRFVEIRAEYLKDYLAARKAALRLYYYRERQAILNSNPGFTWAEDNSLVDEPHYRCMVRCDEIDSSGDFPGASWAFFKAWRTDVDPEVDVPDFSIEDEDSTATESRTGIRDGEGRRYRVTGEMWRGEWIEPAEKPCRIMGEEPHEFLSVTIDGGGGKVDLETLNHEEVGKYLWFRPEVVNALLLQRGGVLNWYTHDTGGVSASPDWLVHFGVNGLGLLNAYAYDIARRPLWERRIWAAHNCRPDGGVSGELLKAQMECAPAGSKSPEYLFHYALRWLDDIFQEKFGASLFSEHHEVQALSARIHRFRAVDENGLRALAKDVVKLSIERINKKSLIDALGEKKSESATLKLLQRLLAKHTSEKYAYTRMTPLFGLYDLRGTDAHLASSDVDECYSRLGVDRKVPTVLQAADLLTSVAEAFGITGTELKTHA